MNNDIKQSIMEKIRDGKIKMRSRWIFIAQKLGLESGLVLAIIMAILLVNAVLYIMQQNGVFEFISFGGSGLVVLLDNIPYDLLIILIILLIMANYLLKKFEISYQKHFYFISLLVFTLIFFLGSVMAFSGLNDLLKEKKELLEVVRFENAAAEFTNDLPNNVTISKPVNSVNLPKPIKHKIRLFQGRIISRPYGTHALIGVIVACDPLIKVMTNDQKTFVIKLEKLNLKNNLDCQEGSTFKSIGNLLDDSFQAEKIQLIRSR